MLKIKDVRSSEHPHPSNSYGLAQSRVPSYVLPPRATRAVIDKKISGHVRPNDFH